MLNARALDKSAVTEWVLVYKQQCGSHGRKKSMRFAENEPSVGRDDTGKLTVRLQFKWIVPSLWRFYASAASTMKRLSYMTISMAMHYFRSSLLSASCKLHSSSPNTLLKWISADRLSDAMSCIAEVSIKCNKEKNTRKMHSEYLFLAEKEINCGRKFENNIFLPAICCMCEILIFIFIQTKML